MRTLFLGTTALVLTMAALPAAAQQGAETPTAAGAQAEDGANDGLEEIVVTAQRREENLQRAAVAVGVVSGDDLIRNGVSTSAALNQLVPSLTVQSAGGPSTTFFVRGVGNFTVNGYSDPAVAFNYDGVYLGRPTSTSGVYYDLERVEVLRGPQGTLYGRNATAGAINVIPARPRPGENSGYVSAAYGNYNALNVQGALNLALGSEGAIRVSGNVVDRDGYLSDGTSDEVGHAFRFQMLGNLQEGLTARVGLDYSHTGGRGVGSNYEGSFRFDNPTNAYVVTPSGLDRSIGLLDPRAQAYRQTLFAGLPGRRLGPLDDNTYQDNDFYGFNAEVAAETPVGTLTVIPAYRFSRLDFRFAVPSFLGWQQEEDEQFSLEARLGGKASIFDYILGAYYFDENIEGNYTFSQAALSVHQDFASTTRSYAFFGRLTANVTDRLRVVGGLRYTNDLKKFDGVGDRVTIVCTVRVNNVPSCPTAPLFNVTDTIAQLNVPTPNRFSPPVPLIGTGAIVSRGTTIVNASLPNNRFTYRAAVEFDVAPRSLLYASIETGFRSGGFSVSTGYETYQPEYITAYTIGSKNRLFDNRLQLNLEAFWWNYRNQQVAHTGTDRAGEQGNFTENVGRSRIRGVEAEAQFLLTPNTLLRIDGQYLDARYKSFVYQVPTGTSPPFTGCPSRISTANPAFRDVDCSAFPAFNSPKWTINLGAQQTVPLGGTKLVFAADTQYRSSRFVGFEYVAFQRSPSTWVSNATVTFAQVDNRWSIGAFVRNLENERELVFAHVYNIGGSVAAVTTPPRTYGAQASVRF